MLDKVRRTISENALIAPESTVIAALSGGADSVAMLFALNMLRDEFKFELKAAHLNHNIRGEEAVRDENFCREFCLKLGVEIFIKSVDILKTASENKISAELAGRNERYAFFKEISQRYNNSLIATAHTASDNLETLIFNISRGTGLDGLCGIPMRRENIIRPLLKVTRDEVERFCGEHSLEYMTDSTNAQTVYSRNKIRATVVPVLKELNPSVESAVFRLNVQAGKISALINAEAEKALKAAEVKYGWSCKKILENEAVIREKMLVLIAQKSSITNLEKRHIDLFEKILYNGGTVVLPGGSFADARQGVVRIVSNTQKPKPPEIVLYPSDKESAKIEFCGKEYTFAFSDEPPQGFDNVIALNDLSELTVRNRREGDMFTLSRRKVTKSVKKLLNEQKIPSELRDSLLLIEQNGKIIWLESVGSSAQNDNLSKNIKLFLKITISHHI